MKAWLFAFILICLSPSGNADESEKQRIRGLEEKLRCLVCQNQSLADSNAELAEDLRGQVRAQVKAGKTDDQIVAYLVERYGDFVLYEPPFKATTVLLWVGPFLLLAVGVAALILALRRRRSAAEELPLGPEQKRLAERMLGSGDPQ
jgi:cytochrome c-type biogenesis protein CcmH